MHAQRAQAQALIHTIQSAPEPDAEAAIAAFEGDIDGEGWCGSPVRALARRGANPNKSLCHYGCALCWGRARPQRQHTGPHVSGCVPWHHCWTPLHWALHRGNGDTALLLLARGADALVADQQGRTPCQVADGAGAAAILAAVKKSSARTRC